jgi:hypothetical protein
MCGAHAKAKSVEYFMLFYKLTEQKALKRHKKYHRSFKNSNLPSTLGYWLNKGHSEEDAKKLISTSQNRTSLEAFVRRYGKLEGKRKYSEFCLKKSIQYSNQGNPRYGASLSNELKGTISKATKKAMQSSEVKENYIKRFLGNSDVLLSSKVEVAFGKMLKQLGIDLVEQFPITVDEKHVWSNKLSNKIAYVFDFKVKGRKVLIEVQGDYIHANPKIFTSDMVINYFGGSFKAKDKWIKDALKKNYAKSKGYKVFIVWESDDLQSKAEQISDYLSHRSPKRVCNEVTKD